MLDAVRQPREGRRADLLMGDLQRSRPRNLRRGFQAVETGDGAVEGNAHAARLEFLNQTVGLVVRGTDPCGDAVLADLLGNQIRNLAGLVARRRFMNVENPI
jgi:hypothetical protein